MAEGTIRIVSESDKNSNGQTGNDDEFHVLTDSELREHESRNSNNGTPSKSAKDRRREKRASLRVTDRGNESSEVSDTQPTKRTPPPTKKPATQTVARFMSETESLQNAKFYMGMIEYFGVAIAGMNGEMTEFERVAMTPAMQRSLRRIPIQVLEKGNVVLDSVLLGGGMLMYFSRISGGIRFRKQNPKKGVQEDMAAPISQPMETVVPTTKAGDIDGIAVPVPEVFQRYMNGSI